MKTVLIILGIIIGIILLLGIGIIGFLWVISNSISTTRHQDDTPTRESGTHTPKAIGHTRVNIKDIFTPTNEGRT